MKPYNGDLIADEGGVTRIRFEPDSQVQAIYRGDLTFPAGSGAAFLAVLEYDADGEGGVFAFADMGTCGIRDATSLPTVSSVVSNTGSFAPTLTPGTDSTESGAGGAFRSA